MNPFSIFLSLRDSDVNDHKKKIKGLKGFGKFLHDLSHEDDFMGRAFFLLKVMVHRQYVPFLLLSSFVPSLPTTVHVSRYLHSKAI